MFKTSRKLAIISTHPIQYYAPVFQLLAQKMDIKVFYTWGEKSLIKFDKGFKKQIEWDIPLLDGYDYEFLNNTAADPGTHHFKGIINPDGIERIQNYQPDAILIYGWAWHSHLKFLRYFKNKIPVYFRGDSTLAKTSILKSLLSKLYLRWVYTHVDAVFYVGTANKAYFKAHGLKESQLLFAPHAIDNHRFAPKNPEESKEIRTKLGISAEEILILFAGKLEPVKNPMLLLNAFLSLDLPTVHLLFVGNGILENQLKSTANSLGAQSELKPKVHFIDFLNQTEITTAYSSCNLFCLPSKSETWGLVVNEAMASGKPVLVSDKVGCAIDLVHDTHGAIFKSGDITDLIQKLIALTNDKDELKKMGENALKYIQNWSFEEQVNTIETYVNR